MHRVDKKQKKSSARGAGRDTTRLNHPSRNRMERSPIRSRDTTGGSLVPANPGDDGDTPGVVAPGSPEPSQANDSAASPLAMVAPGTSAGGATSDSASAHQQTSGSASDAAVARPSPGASSAAASSRPASPPAAAGGASDSDPAVGGGRTSGHDMGKAATPVSRRQAFRAAKLRQQAIEAGWDSSDTEAAGNMRSSRRRASSMRSSALPPVEETKTDLYVAVLALVQCGCPC